MIEAAGIDVEWETINAGVAAFDRYGTYLPDHCWSRFAITRWRSRSRSPLPLQAASTRIAKCAFDYARRKQLKKVTAVHKANIMNLSDGLFLECIREVANLYPEIEYSESIVDNICMQLVIWSIEGTSGVGAG